MSLVEVKIFFTISIIFVTVISSIPAFWSKISKKVTGYLTECDAFARGIFLGASFTHLLPEAIENYSNKNSIVIISAT